VTETRVSLARQSLKSPRAAAIAGILFAVLYGTSLVLMRLSIPSDPAADTAAWLETNLSIVSLALNLMPFAGIAFLWFIGVARDRQGDKEDRLFATVLLGSGLLFLAMVFVGSALVGGLLSTYSIAQSAMVESGIFYYGRAVTFQILNIYALRMSGLFMISLGTIWLRTGVMHRAWAFVTYVLALVLLVSISYSIWVPLIFPVWVLAVSINILILNFRNRSGEALNPM
jgi:hypothetical protein